MTSGRCRRRCRDERRDERRGEHGAALLVAVVTTMVCAALGGALVLVTITETTIAANFRSGVEAFYAADGAVARVMPELSMAADWDVVLAGHATSALVDGPPGGMRDLGGGATLDLTAATHLVRCDRSDVCSDAAMDAVSEERPWGRNNPRWQLYAYGRVPDVLAAPDGPARLYVVVWVGDDPFEVDGDPLRDGARESAPGHGRLSVRAHAYGAQGIRRGVEAVVERRGDALRIISWREVR